MKISFVGVEGTASGALTGERQALTAYATSDSPTVPQAMGAVPCDTEGNALMGRTYHAKNAAGATDTASTGLAAFATRARLIIQNLSDDTLLWFDFGETAVAGACFKCFPGQILTFDGDSCPAELVSFVCESSQSAAYKAKDW